MEKVTVLLRPVEIDAFIQMRQNASVSHSVLWQTYNKLHNGILGEDGLLSSILMQIRETQSAENIAVGS